MIFNCPSCQAGHSVPVSMIPNGGMELSCRRCGTAFKVDLPTHADEPDLLAKQPEGPLDQTDERPVVDDEPKTGDLEREPEATAVGMENPFDELVSEGRSSAQVAAFSESIHSDSTPSPSPDPADESTHDLDARRFPRTGEHERPTMQIANEPMPLGPDEAGLDPELDSTQRVDVDDDAPLNAPTVATPAPTPSKAFKSDEAPIDDPSSTGAAHRAAIEPSPDLYERVEAGDYRPEEPKLKAPETVAPPPKAWNEPSQSAAHVAEKPPLRRAADALNKAPLPLKVGLSVFPIALGLTLMLTASPPSESSAKVEIAVAAPDAAIVEPPVAMDAPVELEGDRVAAAGHAFVQVDDARLRQKANAKSPVTAKLALGELVKVEPINEEWALVLVEPEGPAGFIPVRLLGPQQSIAKLAADARFEGCESEAGGQIDPCLLGAKQSQDACLTKCGPSARPSVRCVEACGVAFDRCVKECGETNRMDKKGKKKRPR
jgi:predicted Zn finger-like uncharacterized protein